MDAARTARRMWVRFEPYHDVTYFTPESRAATDELGCKGGWMGYFGMRAAPLGEVDAGTVTEVFYNFSPRMVGRAIPDAWAVAPAARFLQARLHGVDGALRRLLGDGVLAGGSAVGGSAVGGSAAGGSAAGGAAGGSAAGGSAVDSAEIAEAAELARAATEAAPLDGRPLAAANAALPWPEQPHLALWQATTVLREHRGDGHVEALREHGLGPCQTLVLFAADNGLAPEYMQKARGWTPQEWQQAADELAERGLLDADGAITADGVEVRRSVERRTDESAAGPWTELGERRTARLAELLEPLALRLAQSNDVMRLNPMALDAAKLLVETA